MRQRIVGILGPKHDERLVPVEEETDVVTIQGLSANRTPQKTRENNSCLSMADLSSMAFCTALWCTPTTG